MQTVKEPIIRRIVHSQGFSAAIIVTIILGAIGLDIVPKYLRGAKEDRYIQSHLDQYAVPSNQNPFFSAYSGFNVLTEDADGDGDLDTILERENSDGSTARILARYLDGKITFYGLAATAVDPSNMPQVPKELRIDYADINGDGMLESIVHIGKDSKTLQSMRIDLIDGRYVLTNI